MLVQYENKSDFSLQDSDSNEFVYRIDLTLPSLVEQNHSHSFLNLLAPYIKSLLTPCKPHTSILSRQGFRVHEVDS